MIAKHILPIMLSERKNGQWWVEPFVGGANIIDKVNHKRLGADIDRYLIEALIAIRDHVDDLPKNNNEFTECDYRRLRSSDEYKYKGYAGFAFSFGAKWFGGWCRDSDGNKRDYVAESYRNAKKQSKLLQGVHFVKSNYLHLEIPDNSLIYCDPPYNNTTKYRHGLDHDVFWEWCRSMPKKGHTLFVSEYNAPSDFECVWQKKVFSGLKKGTGKYGIEKLFKPKKG